MANHCRITCRKKVTPGAINKILHDLNERIFKNTILIKEDEFGWNVHTMHCVPKSESIGIRHIWIENGKFRISHGGGGGDFSWWVDFKITNDVALHYNGKIRDDGISEIIIPKKGKYDSYNDFLLEFHKYMKKDTFKMFMKLEKDMTPKEFHKELKELWKTKK